MQYRRSRIAGATYFFTVNLANRKGALLTEHIAQLRSAIQLVRSRHRFDVPAMVVLPEHLHTLWILPPGDADFATRWALIKAGFSRGVPMQERISASRRSKGERGIWQRRYWEHLIRDDEDYARHVDYIHYNPVKHGHVARAADWPYRVFIAISKTARCRQIGLPLLKRVAPLESERFVGVRRLTPTYGLR